MHLPPATTILPESPADHAAIERLNATTFGPGRFARTAFRIREMAEHEPALSFVAKRDGVLIGSVRMTRILVGPTPAWLLGPLVVLATLKGQGVGKALLARAVEAATGTEAAAVVLVGDRPYYGPFGFVPLDTRAVAMPGPVDPHRLLARPLTGPPVALGGKVIALGSWPDPAGIRARDSHPAVPAEPAPDVAAGNRAPAAVVHLHVPRTAD